MANNENTPVQQQTVADIPVHSLKERFQARSIPLESDFSDLIDVADCGRRTAGLSPDVTPVLDTGLTLDSTTGQLKVQPEQDKGISVAAKGVGVVVAQNKGIQLDAAGIAVKPNAARGVMVDASGVGVNYDTTLQIVNANQLRVTQNYVTKSGDSTISGGSLTFASDDKGISFFGGSRIIKKYGSNMLWYKGTNNAPPQICDNNGGNASNIATENYVNNYVNGYGSSANMNGDVLAFEIGSIGDYWPVDIDFIFSKSWSNAAAMISGRASAIKSSGVWQVAGIKKDFDLQNNTGADGLTAVKLFRNNANGNLAIGAVTGNSNNANLRWRVRINGGILINIGINSFSGYTQLASA
jgi:hypothetical protein